MAKNRLGVEVPYKVSNFFSLEGTNNDAQKLKNSFFGFPTLEMEQPIEVDEGPAEEFSDFDDNGLYNSEGEEILTMDELNEILAENAGEPTLESQETASEEQ